MPSQALQVLDMLLPLLLILLQIMTGMSSFALCLLLVPLCCTSRAWLITVSSTAMQGSAVVELLQLTLSKVLQLLGACMSSLLMLDEGGRWCLQLCPCSLHAVS